MWSFSNTRRISWELLKNRSKTKRERQKRQAQTFSYVLLLALKNQIHMTQNLSYTEKKFWTKAEILHSIKADVAQRIENFERLIFLINFLNFNEKYCFFTMIILQNWCEKRIFLNFQFSIQRLHTNAKFCFGSKISLIVVMKSYVTISSHQPISRWMYQSKMSIAAIL